METQKLTTQIDKWVKDYIEALQRLEKVSGKEFCFVCGTGLKTIEEIITLAKAEGAAEERRRVVEMIESSGMVGKDCFDEKDAFVAGQISAVNRILKQID